MATGDIKNNLYRLQTELRHARYPRDLDYSSLARGSPSEFLSILRYVMCDFSHPLAELILSSNVELNQMSSDQKFMEGVYKILRDQFAYVPRITLPQFFSTRSFAEHKILLTIEVVSLARRKHKQLRKTQARTLSGQAESNKKASSLPNVSLPVNFKPSHNSTLSTQRSPSPPRPREEPQLAVQRQPGPDKNTPAVKIVVVGETPAPRRGTEGDTPDSFSAPGRGDEGQSMGVTSRRQRREMVDGGADGVTVLPKFHFDAAILDSELKTHPVIRDLAITAGDLVSRVQTLEEQVATLTVNGRKSEQRRDAQILLLENKVKLLEAQLTSQRLSKQSQHPHDIISDLRTDGVHSPGRSSSSEGDDVGHFLETVVEEQDGDSVLIIDEGVGSESHEGSL